MTAVAEWHLFAYKNDDPTGVHDEVRALANWQLGDALRWCETRGYDHVYFYRDSETLEFEKRHIAELEHRFHGRHSD